MTALATFDHGGNRQAATRDALAIGQILRRHGLAFGQWPARPCGGSLDEALAAYGAEIDALRAQGFALRSIDRVTLRPGHEGWPQMRQKFISEHTHADAEIRFFIGGRGLFYIRSGDGFVGLLCTARDWVALPAGLRHWFDAGDQPDFDALRLFTTPDGWVAQPADGERPALPLLDAFESQLAGTGAPRQQAARND